MHHSCLFVPKSKPYTITPVLVFLQGRSLKFCLLLPVFGLSHIHSVIWTYQLHDQWYKKAIQQRPTAKIMNSTEVQNPRSKHSKSHKRAIDTNSVAKRATKQLPTSVAGFLAHCSPPGYGPVTYTPESGCLCNDY